ncbi:hypothetical protein C8J56DRAFT_887002 [Mycena floridula]|nr:hypothetical protein C8J56DRAFT_887002 [Mycena floridula]
MSEAMQPGIYSVLVLIVLYKLWTDKARLAARRILIAAAISIFVASTMQVSLVLAIYLIQLPTLGFDPPNVERSLIHMDIFGVAMARLNMGPEGGFFPFSGGHGYSGPTIQGSICYYVSVYLVPLSKIFSYWPEDSHSNVTTVLDKLHFYSSYCIQSLPFKFSLWQAIYPIIVVLLLALEKGNLESTINGPSFSQSLQFASRPQVPTVTQSDDVVLDSMTSHIDSEMPDSDMDDKLDPTMDNRPDSKTNDIAVAEPLEEKMEKCGSSHFG